MKLFPVMLFALLLQVVGLTGPALAADPAPSASCVVTAQNRTAPLPADGNYTIANLPGNGFVPLGNNGSAQPFRARAVCDDGTLGETAMLFPEFESELVYGGAIIWGQNTRKPTRLQLALAMNEISANQTVPSSVTGFYENNATLDLTARASGTGYRSSAAGYVGVSAEGLVFGQPIELIRVIGGVFRLPPQVVITAENEGVVSSRLIQYQSGQGVSGTIYQADGQTPAAGVNIRMVGTEKETSTDSAGKYRLSNLPAGSYAVQLFAWQPSTRSFISGWPTVSYGTTTENVNWILAGSGRVTVQVSDAAQRPLAGEDVTLVDRGNADALENTVRAIGIVQTDANGVARFEGVAAGAVTPVLARGAYVSTPANAILGAGGELIFRVSLNDQTNPTSSLSGTVLESLGRLPGAGFVVRLTERQGLRRTVTAVTAGNGRFSFDQLPASSHFTATVLRNGIALLERVIDSAAAGQRVDVELLYNKPSRVSGTVWHTDATTPAADISVQLRVNVLDSWNFVKQVRTNGQGQYEFAPLPAGAYRLDAIDRNAQVSSSLFDIVSPGSEMVQDITLAPELIITTRAQLDVRVAATNYRIGNAAVYVSNSRCATPCLLGMTQDGTAFLTPPLAPGENRFEIRRGERVAYTTLQVDASTDGKTLQQRVILPAIASDTLDVLTFIGQRNVLGFNALEGEKVNLVVLGAAVGATRPAYTLKVELFDPDKKLLASASGFGFGSEQPSLSTIADVRLDSDGTYGIVVTSNNSNLDQVGGYWIDLLVDGQTRPLQAYAPGGVVQGKVLRADNSAAQNQMLALTGNDPLNVQQRVQTNGVGEFRFEGVPLGGLSLKALLDEQILARAEGLLERDGQVQTLNLVLAPTSATLTGRVLFGNQQVAADAPVWVRRASNHELLASARTDENGHYRFVQLPPGVELVMVASNPLNQIEARIAVPALTEAEQSAPDIIFIATGSVLGLVKYTNGDVIVNAQIRVAGTATSGFTLSVNTDNAGRFQISGVPVGVPLVVTATTAGIANTQQQTVTIRDTDQVLNLPDFVFPKTTLVISLLDGDGQPNDLLSRGSTAECGANKVLVQTSAGPVVLRANEWLVLEGLPPGLVNVGLYGACSEPDPEHDIPIASTSTVLAGSGAYQLDMLVPIISGTVKLSDGRFTYNPDVELTQTRSGITRHVGSTTDNALQAERGGFNLVGVEQGDFTIRVRDSNRNLATSIAGQLEQVSNLNVNVLLDAPPFDGLRSDVVGRVTHGGVPVASGFMILLANGYERITFTDYAGVYVLQDVPAGRFTLGVGTDNGFIEFEGQAGAQPVITLDVNLPLTEPLRKAGSQKMGTGKVKK